MTMWKSKTGVKETSQEAIYFLRRDTEVLISVQIYEIHPKNI